MRKLFLFLCAALMSVGMFAATEVTITQNDFPSWGQSFTKDGVTVSAGYAIDGQDGNIMGGGSFSTTLGNFTKIEISAMGVFDLGGEGWSIVPGKATWTGNASSVSFTGDVMGGGQGTTLIFTIGGSEPEPEPEPAGNTVTWDNTNVFNAANSGVELSKWNPDPLTFEGITISFTGTGASSEFRPYKTGNANLECYGNDGDSFTFTAPSGKQFTKIEITDNDFIVFTEYGDWTKPELNKIEWNGTAASEVTLGGSNNTFASDLTSIVFTLADPEPEPEPEPAGDEITVTWNNPSGYGFEFTQDGVTLTCGEITYKDFYGPGTFTTELGNFTKIEVYAEGGCLFSGDGWSGDDNQKTWTGNAASVSFSYDIYVPTSIVFTIEPAATPEPQPVTDPITPYADPQDASVYYSTFYDSNFKYELPAGVEAYVADLSGANLLLTKIAEAGEVIPADNAVILKSSVTPFTLTKSDAAAVTFTATNDLQGSDTQIATPANCYVLAGTDGVVGFYHYTAANLNAHKAYVVYSGSNQAPRRMPFIFDQATGVENVQGGHVQSTKVIENGVLYIIKNGVKYNAQGQVVK